MYEDESKVKDFKEALREGRKKYFLGKTFAAKLFIKLCSKVVDTSIVCMEILNFEIENRTKEDVETVLPWMKELNYFYEYISLKETEESKKEILRNIIWVLYRKIFYKNTITKKINDNNNLLCIVLEGYLLKLDLVFYRQVLSLEEYLIYLIKMEILDEKDIIHKCKLLNKYLFDINTNSISEFCEKYNNIYEYSSMKEQALKEIKEYGIIFPKKTRANKNNQNNKFKSLDNYLNIFLSKSNPKTLHDKTKAYFNFYLGKYVKNGIIEKGKYIGSFLKTEIKDYSRYIAKEKCIVGLINKENYNTNKLHLAYKQKMIKVFSEIKNNFFIFNHIQDDIFYQNYIPYMHYHKYFKGEKIFLQNSIYEGIFFLIKGTVKISINTSIDEMHNSMTYLTFSLNNFNDYISGFKTDELTQQNFQNCLKIQDKEMKYLYSKKDDYDLMTIKEYNIIGTNEAYVHQTELYNFTAECISDSAVLYFFPKMQLNILLSKEKNVYNSYIHLVEFRIKDIIWKMKRHITEFERKIKRQKNNHMVNTLSNYIKNANMKNKIIHRNEKNELNNILFLTKNEIDNNFMTHRNIFFDSKTNLIEGIKIKNIKKILIENEKNKEGFLTSRNINAQYRDNNNLYIPTIHSISRNQKKDLYYSRSQTKNMKNNYKKNIFPYIVMDTLNKRGILKNISMNNNNNGNIKQKIKIRNLSNIKLKKLFINKNKG